MPVEFADLQCIPASDEIRVFDLRFAHAPRFEFATDGDRTRPTGKSASCGYQSLCGQPESAPPAVERAECTWSRRK
ncbi:hypothetical protein ACVWY6_000502 [Williamsia sp. R60]